MWRREGEGRKGGNPLLAQEQETTDTRAHSDLLLLPSRGGPSQVQSSADLRVCGGIDHPDVG
jgi:hypothetical protein